MLGNGIHLIPSETISKTGEGIHPVEGWESPAARRLRHDLRQPLSSITFLADSVMSTENLPPHVVAALAEIVRETEWMGRLLRSAEDDAEEIAVVDLSAALEGPCAAAQVTPPWEVEVTTLERAPVLVDRVGLERSVRNVLDNAKRAVRDGGRVEVRVWPNDEHGVLEVADSGPGFGRLAPRHGHGLVGVRRFVERFGGELTCGSSSLGGALVTMRLPLALGW